MSIIYNEDDALNKRGGFQGIDIYKMNPTKPYKTHLTNWYYLQFIVMNPISTFQEKHQAAKELVICDRKLQFWYHHPYFDIAQAGRDTSALQKDWALTKQPKHVRK